MRSDDIGMFWQDIPTEKGARSEVFRPTPPIPNTGWRPPSDFPDLRGAGMICIDTETCDPDLRSKGPGCRRGAYIAGIAVGTDDGFRGYFPMRHKMGGNLDPDTVLNWLSEQLADSDVPKVGANLLYDLDILANEGVDCGRGRNYDVQNAEPLLDEYKRSYALETLGEEYLGEGKVSEALYRWSAAAFGGLPNARDQAGNIWRCPVELVGPYAEGDVDLPIRIFEKQRSRLEADNLWNVFDLETRLIPILLAMRQRGVRIDFDQADIVEQELTVLITSLAKELGGLNVNASSDIEQLCNKHGITYPRTAATKAYPKGNPSFQKEWLENHDHPLMRKISDARTYLKYRDTFITSYLRGNHVKNRIHTSFNQLRSDEGGTVTGRFSSSNPNLQNIPKRGKGKIMRSPFVPDEGEDLVRFDWSQIEYRLLVHKAVGRGSEEARRMYCDDPNTDFHEFVMKLTNLDRDYAKTINFGFTFGMGADLLCRTLGVSRERGLSILNTYHGTVPFVRATAEAASKAAAQREVIVTILGRKARFPGGEFTHKALNRFTQGSSADIMKASMVAIWESGVCDVLGAPLLTVHDELLWSAPRTDEAKEALAECKNIMETTVPLKVPTPVAMEVGSNWSNCTVAPNHLEM